MRQHALAELTGRTKELRQMFESLNDVNVRSMPEAIFVRDFLPLFGGHRVSNATELMKIWYLCAGTPYMPVDLVDQYGRKVIQVPAVLDNVHMNVVNRSPEGMPAVVEEAKQLSQMSPAAADGLVMKALGQRVNRVEIPRTVSAEWQKVFDHYKFKTQFDRQEEAAAAPEQKPADDNESAFEM